jgi:hypothetical protein
MLKHGGAEVAAAVHATVSSSFQHGASGIQIISTLHKVMGTITGPALPNINEGQRLEWQCGFRR